MSGPAIPRSIGGSTAPLKRGAPCDPPASPLSVLVGVGLVRKAR